MASLNGNPTLQTFWEFFEQIYNHVDKINPGDKHYTNFKAVVKCHEQFPRGVNEDCLIRKEDDVIGI